MKAQLIHLCYSGTSGATAAALTIAAGAAEPSRHAYVFYGVEAVRPDYVQRVEQLGCGWAFVLKGRGLDLRCYWRAAKAIAAMAQQVHGPAVAVLHGCRSLPVAAALRVLRPRLAILTVQHGPLAGLEHGRGKLLAAAFSSLGCRTVAVSAEVSALLAASRLLRWATRRRLVTIPNGVDAAAWRAAPLEDLLAQCPPARELRIGMVATLEQTKDHATLLHAAALLADRRVNVRLELAGAGPLEATLRELASQLGIAQRVAFLGNLSAGQVREALARWHVVVHSTHGEAMSMAVLEAMAAGRAVVASDYAGLREVLNAGQAGPLVPPDDPQALAATLEHLAREPQLLLRYAQAAREQARKNFSAAAMATRYEAAADAVAG